MENGTMQVILRAVVILAVIYVAIQLFGIALPAWGGFILLLIALVLIFRV